MQILEIGVDFWVLPCCCMHGIEFHAEAAFPGHISWPTIATSNISSRYTRLANPPRPLCQDLLMKVFVPATLNTQILNFKLCYLANCMYPFSSRVGQLLGKPMLPARRCCLRTSKPEIHAFKVGQLENQTKQAKLKRLNHGARPPKVSLSSWKILLMQSSRHLLQIRTPTLMLKSNRKPLKNMYQKPSRRHPSRKTSRLQRLQVPDTNCGHPLDPAAQGVALQKLLVQMVRMGFAFVAHVSHAVALRSSALLKVCILAVLFCKDCHCNVWNYHAFLWDVGEISRCAVC